MKFSGASHPRFTIPLVAVAITLLISAHRLLAPISEAPQPTPTPKREATPRSKPKPEATPKPKASPNLSFAGNWAGPVTAIASNGQRGNSNYILRISDDEKTVWINWNLVGQTISGAGYQASCNRFRGALTWSFVFPGEIITDTLRLNANGTANFTAEGKWTTGDNAGLTFTHTGVFLRQAQ
jgi:hypothetical protein